MDSLKQKPIDPCPAACDLDRCPKIEAPVASPIVSDRTRLIYEGAVRLHAELTLASPDSCVATSVETAAKLLRTAEKAASGEAGT